MHEVKMRAVAVLMLGLLVLAGCDWFEAQPETNLPPDTLLTECASGQAVTEGDDVTFAWTATDIDGRVTGFEVSYDGDLWEPTGLDSMTVTAVTRGEHTFRVRAVDDDGEADPDPATCDFTASIAGRAVDRTVLIEIFTTNICEKCPEAETIIADLVAEAGGQGIAVVAYHDDPSEIPGSDPLATEETDARIAWYTDNPLFPGESDTWPTVVFDGLRTVVGVRTTEEARALYTFEIGARSATPSPLSLRIAGDISAVGGEVTAVARAEDGPPEGPLVLRFALIEDQVKFRGIWASRYDFVTRRLLEDEALDLAAVGDSVVVTRDIGLDPSWVAENLDVVAFVQNTQTLEIIQAGSLRGE
jgi:hypothetical protein